MRYTSKKKSAQEAVNKRSDLYHFEKRVFEIARAIFESFFLLITSGSSLEKIERKKLIKKFSCELIMINFTQNTYVCQGVIKMQSRNSMSRDNCNKLKATKN